MIGKNKHLVEIYLHGSPDISCFTGFYELKQTGRHCEEPSDAATSLSYRDLING